MLDEMLKEFYDISKSLSSEKDVLKLFDKIISSSLKLTSADAATIYTVIDRKTEDWSSVKSGSFNGKLLKFSAAKNFSFNLNLKDITQPITSRSIFGYTVITGKSLRIDDVYSIDETEEYRHNNKFDISNGYVTKSVLSIPMKDRDDHITGVIQLINKKTAGDVKLDFSNSESLLQILPFGDTDELIMNSLAGQAAVALENAVLYKNMQNLLKDYKEQNKRLLSLSKEIMKAHEEERKRIAREIHDGPAQSAVNLSLRLEICKRLLPEDCSERLKTEMSNLNQFIQSTVKEIRTIIYDLKPSCLESGLLEAVNSHIINFSENTGLTIWFNHSGDDSAIEYYMTSTIYRIVQEALSNVYKHAKATTVNISLKINKSSLQLIIEDNGRGFNVQELKTRKFDRLKGGFGLEGIRERVELVNGRLNITSTPGSGTLLSISIPLT